MYLHSNELLNLTVAKKKKKIKKNLNIKFWKKNFEKKNFEKNFLKKIWKKKFKKNFEKKNILRQLPWT